MTSYMGCQTATEKSIRELLADGPVLVQTKMDGQYANLIVKGDEVTIESRQGKTKFLGNAFDHLVGGPCGYVLQGELVIPGVDRFVSNGIIARLTSIGDKKSNGKCTEKQEAETIKEYGDSYENLLKRIKYVSWDFLSLEEYKVGKSDSPYEDRLSKIVGRQNVAVVETREAHDYGHVMELFNLLLERGEEGIVLKAAKGVYKNGKPKWQLKMKQEATVELEIIGFNRGTKGTRLENSLGSLKCASSDRLVVTDPSGLSDVQRKEIWEDKERYLGLIVEVKSNGLTKCIKGTYSLLHPSFVKFRDDKTADDLKAIKAACAV